jgi:hypothetical protein
MYYVLRRNCDWCQGLIDLTSLGASDLTSASFVLLVTSTEPQG